MKRFIKIEPEEFDILFRLENYEVWLIHSLLKIRIEAHIHALRAKPTNEMRIRI